mmetsp:Transcript_873/g.1967  ORF Transcript_873/g.1967 Transcript_873/m.1967 type:complete len:404 (+) Transcript_873:242-1453(+)|eukprot:CAMPEP_0206519614 /NCGR_PEP_ID=MMETSP0324_2-20121206/65311_1 /ASSEMBLY_ACC=CAM_ASM_000836 /TAXON_ID=2866 /ORGANISM="Crypthecodinium cohnii, Strain Seligo" /LENGTH=403 /DNA_ID=CAMNT_0054013259 /DNA_START=163 /DNA_END=1374 /DNA_ORIENTATION=-
MTNPSQQPVQCVTATDPARFRDGPEGKDMRLPLPAACLQQQQQHRRQQQTNLPLPENCATSGKCHLVVIRHGERLDEADRIAWSKQKTEATRYDAPLTAAGWRQATAVGKKVKASLRQAFGADRPRIVVFSSPAARTMATAAAVAEQIGAPVVEPVYSLNCAAAAQKRGVRGLGVFNTMSEEELARWNVKVGSWPPLGDPAEADELVSRAGGFVAAIKVLASLQAPGTFLVLVSHREGIWELCRHLRCELKTSYCSDTFCEYDFANRKLESWDPSGHVHAPLLTRTKSEEEQALEDAINVSLAVLSSSSPKTKEEVLAAGAGSLAFRRPEGGDGDGVVARTRLWQTPGVRGVWVDDIGIPQGSVVSILSTPQPSEEEGDFVLIRTTDGREGWAKVKNLIGLGE